MTKADTARLMATLCDVFDKKASKGLLLAYHDALNDLDATEVSEAARRIIATEQWFPKPAQIRAEVASARVTAPELDEAWGLVLSAVRRYGRYRKSDALDALDPAIARAVESVGWEAICNSEMIASERRTFLDAYKELRSRIVRGEQLPAPTERRIDGPSKEAKQLGEALSARVLGKE